MKHNVIAAALGLSLIGVSVDAQNSVSNRPEADSMRKCSIRH
jgi:hypothetical protein